MSINLAKGQKIDLTKGNVGIDKLMVGLGWDPVQVKRSGIGGLFGQITAPNIDCDASVIMLDERGKIASQKDVIYFGRLRHSSGSVKHMGDNLTGEGDGDDEQIFIQLSQIPESIHKLVFVVNIFDCRGRRQDFGMIQNAYIRIIDENSKKEMAKFNLSDDYKGFTALITGEVYRHNGEWKFAALGEATRHGSLKELIGQYS